MPSGVYKRKNLKQCPKCTKTFNKMGIANHISHCKGVADKIPNENLRNLLTKSSVIEQATIARNEEENLHSSLRRAHNDYAVLSKENENLKRLISTQREVIDTLCRAMVEINSVEGRWRA